MENPDVVVIARFFLRKQDVRLLESINFDVENLLLRAIELHANSRFEECVETVQVVLDMTWEQLNTGHWSLVPDSERAIYSAASLMKVAALVQQAFLTDGPLILQCLKKALHTADMGLLLGNSYRDQLTTAATILSQTINQSKQREEEAVTNKKAISPLPEPCLQVSVIPVRELHCPSLECFSCEHFYPRLPVKLFGCMGHWPALRRWSRLDYLLEVCGQRTVPVELGSSYSDDDWSQRLMPLHQFISQYICNPSHNTPVGYLAQHHLFDQVPELRKDITVPDYCGCSEEEGEVDINAWFGPAGTVSPLHHDPKHNLFCQVVGRKRLVLYSPSASDCLYPNEGRLLSNTAKVDPEAPDYTRFPKYQGVQGFHCQLGPGEMLYIPPTWWHHVRALDLSFSVSFWWT